MRIDIHRATNLLYTHAKDIELVFRKAVREAVLEHKRANNPIAIWRDGKVVILQPDEIVIDDEEEEE
jgi:hypothetical protein